MSHRWARVLRSPGIATRRSRIVAAVALVMTTLLVGVGAAFAVNHDPAPTYTGCLTLSGGTITSVAQGDAPLKPCKPGQVLIRLSSGDITAVTAGTGLTGGGGTGDVSLAIAESYQLPQTCSAGQLPAWNGSGWTCATDANTTYTAGTGLDLNGSEFSVEPSHRLPQGCSTDQIAKWNGSAWECKPDGAKLTTLQNTAVDQGIPDDGAPHVITSVPVSEAGTYIVMAKGTITSVLNVDDFSSVGCSIPDDSVSLGSQVTNEVTRIPFALFSRVGMPAGSSLSLTCDADDGADGVGINDVVLIAIKVE